MANIKKLSNVQYTMTDEVISRKWSEVISKRNKLLSLSDWTQLSDSNVPANIQRLWIKWREKIRNIKRSTVTDPDKALTLLKNLEKQMPEKLSTSDVPLIEISSETKHNVSDDSDDLRSYIDNQIKTILPKIISLTEISNLINQKSDNNLQVVLQRLEDKINEAKPKFNLSSDIDDAKIQLSSVLNEYIYKKYPRFNDELFAEAVDYLSGSYSGDLPLLQLYSNNNNKSLDEMANEMLQAKRKWIKDVCEIEKYRLENLNKIKESVTISELEEILTKIS